MQTRLAQAPHTPNPWFLRPRPLSAPRMRVFCFPYAGGSASVYHQWAAGLPSDVELIAVQYPGRGTRMRETPYTDIADLLDGFEPALRPLLDRPFAFFGHSMGATIAFEVARRLHAQQAPLPSNLFLSGRSAPHRQPQKDFTHLMSDAEFIDTMRAFNGTPAEILDHSELMAMMLPMLRADFKAIETWQHQDSAPFEIPLSVFGGLNDPGVPIECLDGWADYTTQKMKRHLFPGDHFYLLHQYPAILNIISRALGNA